jgi:hypothetical protein
MSQNPPFCCLWVQPLPDSQISTSVAHSTCLCYTEGPSLPALGLHRCRCHLSEPTCKCESWSPRRHSLSKRDRHTSLICSNSGPLRSSSPLLRGPSRWSPVPRGDSSPSLFSSSLFDVANPWITSYPAAWSLSICFQVSRLAL